MEYLLMLIPIYLLLHFLLKTIKEKKTLKDLLELKDETILILNYRIKSLLKENSNIIFTKKELITIKVSIDYILKESNLTKNQIKNRTKIINKINNINNIK